MQNAGFIMVNGAVSTPEKAVVSAVDRGLLFGDGIFETMVAFGDKILDLAKHLDRLRRSAAEVRMEVPWSDEALTFELSSMNEMIAAPKKQIRFVMTRGSALGLSKTDLQPNRYIYASPADMIEPRLLSVGLRVKRKALPFTLRGSAPKTLNYQRSVIALQEAKIEGFDDVLWSNSEGEVCEAATANIFLVARQGDRFEVVTPPPHSGILCGITRETILQLFAESRLSVTEQVVFVDELPRFDEAFLCSTVRGLVPVASIDHHKLHTMHEKSLFRAIQVAHAAWVKTQLGYAVDWRTGVKVSM